MYLCYIDESGTPEVPGNTSHFVLSGLAIPIWNWKDCEREVSEIKSKVEYNLKGAEIHTGWILRRYVEQNKIEDFDSLDHRQRRWEVEKYRRAELIRLQKENRKRYKQTKKNYRKTEDYIHLTYQERKSFIKEVAEVISNWGFARLFAECIDKVYFNPSPTRESTDEQAFEQLVSRFEQFLKFETGNSDYRMLYGLLIHDNNQTVAEKHTELMKRFHQKGTGWTGIENIIETPLFVDSQLTGLVQIADLCAYSLRRYLENKEECLFSKIFKRADRRGKFTVGVRHYTEGCSCKICSSHSS